MEIGAGAQPVAQARGHVAQRHAAESADPSAVGDQIVTPLRRRIHVAPLGFDEHGVARRFAVADAIRIETSAPIRVDGVGIETAPPVASLQAQLAAAASIFDADAARLAQALSDGFDG